MRTAISPAISRRLASREAVTSTSTGSARMPQASLRCDNTCAATVVTAAASADDGPGAAADCGQFVARDLGDQFGNQIRLAGEIAVDRTGGDIGANRDRRDLHRGH